MSKVVIAGIGEHHALDVAKGSARKGTKIVVNLITVTVENATLENMCLQRRRRRKYLKSMDGIIESTLKAR